MALSRVNVRVDHSGVSSHGHATTVAAAASNATLIARCVEGAGHAVAKVLLSRPDLVNTAAANPRLYGSYPLHFAAQKGRASVVALLLERGAEVDAVNERGKSPLHFAAAEAGSAGAVAALLDGGAAVDRRTGDAAGETAAHIAARVGNTPVLDELRSRGADLTLENGSGHSVLDIERIWRMERGYATPTTLWFDAIERGELDTVRAMLYSGEAHIEGRSSRYGHEVTGLVFAAMLLRDAGPAAELLLAEGANVNARDERGRTPLMYAVEGGNVSVVRALLAAQGIDVNAVDADGSTALHLGFTYFLVPSIARALLAAGADANRLAASESDNDVSPLELAFQRAVTNVRRDGSYDELWMHGVELRAAFVPYQVDTPGWERSLILATSGGPAVRRAAAAAGTVGRAALYLAVVMGMAVSLPVLILGSLFSSKGLRAPLSLSLEDLFLARSSQVMAPVFGVIAVGALVVTALVLPSLAQTDPGGGEAASLGTMLGFVALFVALMGALGYHSIKDRTLRAVDRPSATLRVNAINVYTLALFALQFVQLWGLTYHPDVHFPSGAAGEATVRSTGAATLLGVSSGSRTAFEGAFFASFVCVLVWALASAHMALGLVAEYSLHLSAVFPGLGSGSLLDYYVLDVVIPLLTSGAFLPVVLSMLRSVKCTAVGSGEDAVFVLDAATSVTCWAGDHTWIASSALLSLLWYVPSALVLGVIFLRSYAATSGGTLDVKYAPVYSLIELPVRAMLGALRIFFSDSVWVYLPCVGVAFVGLLVSTAALRPFRDAGDVDASDAVLNVRSGAVRAAPATCGSLTSTRFGGILNRALVAGYIGLVVKVVINLWATGGPESGAWPPVVVQHVLLGGGAAVYVGVEVMRVRRARAHARAHAHGSDDEGEEGARMRSFIDIYGHAGDDDAALDARLATMRLPSQGGQVEDAEFMAMQQVLQEQLSVAQRERDRARAKHERASQQVELLRETVASLLSQVSTLETELGGLRNEGLADQLARSQQALVDVGEDYDALRVELERANAETDVLREQVDALKTIANLEAERGRSEAVFYEDDEVAAALEQARMRIGALETLLDAAVGERDEVGRAYDELEADLVAVKLRLAENEFEKQRVLTEARKAKRKARALEAKVAQLETFVMGGLVVEDDDASAP